MSDMANNRFSIEIIIPHMFVGPGAEGYGRLVPLCLVVGSKSLQVNVAHWEEEPRCEVSESQRQIGKHLQEARESPLEPVCVTHHF